MAKNKNDPHRHDPRWIIAKFAGIDAQGRRFGKGDRVFYYPVFDEILSGTRADEAEHFSIADPAA